MSAAQSLRLRRFNKVLAAIKRWEAKERRAKNALRKLRKTRAYYMKLAAADKPAPSSQALADRKASARHNRIARGSLKAREVALAHLPRTEAEPPAEVARIVAEAGEGFETIHEGKLTPEQLRNLAPLFRELRKAHRGKA